jgi:hypothetical protein
MFVCLSLNSLDNKNLSKIAILFSRAFFISLSILHILWEVLWLMFNLRLPPSDLEVTIASLGYLKSHAKMALALAGNAKKTLKMFHNRLLLFCFEMNEIDQVYLIIHLSDTSSLCFLWTNMKRN